MANTTDKAAVQLHGSNPQFLIDKILRTKIQDCTYWKQHCFGATAASLVDLAADLDAVGGTTTALRRPTPFLCLLLKLLQLGPSKDVVAEYVANDELKYLRVLGAVYVRLAWRPAEVFQTLEPLLADYRRLRSHVSGAAGGVAGYELTTVDAVVDALLTEASLFDVALPRLPPRRALEESGALPGPRTSVMDAAADAAEAAEAEEAERVAAAARAEAAARLEEGEVGGGGSGGDRGRRRARSRSRSRSRSPRRRREKWQRRSRSRSPQRRRARSRSRSGERARGRRGSRSPPRREGGGGGGGGGGGDAAMSVDETNALRARLGLAPLK